MATAVSADPTTGSPWTAGLETKTGAESARATAGSQTTAARTASDTGTWSRRRADIPNKYASIVGAVGAFHDTVFAKQRSDFRRGDENAATSANSRRRADRNLGSRRVALLLGIVLGRGLAERTGPRHPSFERVQPP